MSDDDSRFTAGVIDKPFDYDDLIGQVERATARERSYALSS